MDSKERADSREAKLDDRGEQRQARWITQDPARIQPITTRARTTARAMHTRDPLIHAATPIASGAARSRNESTSLLVERLPLFVEERAHVLRQFSPEELNACGFRIRTHYLVGARNSWRFVIHDLLLYNSDYLPQSLFNTSLAQQRYRFRCLIVALTAHSYPFCSCLNRI